jgi:GAF domain-containing protein
VTGDPNIIFYAGMPITGPKDMHVGALCVIDTKKPRVLTDKEKELLRDLTK